MDSTTFVSQLRAIGMWPTDAPVQQAVEELSRQTADARLLARDLIQRDLLTPFQANQLLTGKGNDLVVGPYHLLERLGQGAAGQVFKARHQRLHRIMALKLIHADRLTSPVAIARFHREIEVAASFAHPNVVRAYDADQAGTNYYFAMQYVPGTDLSHRVKQSGPLPIAEACDVIRQAALGLQHIHDHGMAHRDIKPSNLAIVEGGPQTGSATDPACGSLVPGQVKILDLGLARLCEEPSEEARRKPALTQLGAVMGTADYMAPEQGRDSRAADARSDLYSLGCTLYFALTGQPPFPGGTPLEKMMHHQLDEARPVEALRPEVPPTLRGIVRKLMAKEPTERFQTAAEVATILAPLCQAASQAVPIQATGNDASAPQAIPVAAPLALDLASPEFALSPAAAGRLGLTPEGVRPLTSRRIAEWSWVVVAGAVTVGVLVVAGALRLIFR
jgi:serine/threonine-protein kinase